MHTFYLSCTINSLFYDKLLQEKKFISDIFFNILDFLNCNNVVDIKKISPNYI